MPCSSCQESVSAFSLFTIESAFNFRLFAAKALGPERVRDELIPFLNGKYLDDPYA